MPTSFPPMASNIFSSWTRSCWMLFIRMQGWSRDRKIMVTKIQMIKWGIPFAGTNCNIPRDWKSFQVPLKLASNWMLSKTNWNKTWPWSLKFYRTHHFKEGMQEEFCGLHEASWAKMDFRLNWRQQGERSNHENIGSPLGTGKSIDLLCIPLVNFFSWKAVQYINILIFIIIEDMPVRICTNCPLCEHSVVWHLLIHPGSYLQFPRLHSDNAILQEGEQGKLPSI